MHNRLELAIAVLVCPLSNGQAAKVRTIPAFSPPRPHSYFSLVRITKVTASRSLGSQFIQLVLLADAVVNIKL